MRVKGGGKLPALRKAGVVVPELGLGFRVQGSGMAGTMSIGLLLVPERPIQGTGWQGWVTMLSYSNS